MSLRPELRNRRLWPPISLALVTSTQPVRIGGNTMLPARREPIILSTSDGLRLVGELALPAGRSPRATLVCLHPLPTHGGMMDSHLFRKAAFRLPALAGLAVLRFNTRGTVSEAGRSEGAFDEGFGEGHDVAAALDYCRSADLPDVWLVGWSFGTELALMHGGVPPVRGAVLISPALKRAQPEHLKVWAESGKPVVCLVPEFDDYLRPEQAREQFAAVPQARVVAFPGGKHLLVGQAEEVLDAVVATVSPEVATPLPRTWNGEYETRKVAIVND
jgi:alpha/beta superfamily hydrolase